MLTAYIDPGAGMTVTTFGGWLAALLLGALAAAGAFLRRLRPPRGTGRWLLLAAVLVVLIALGGWLMMSKKSAHTGRIVILGFDGMDPGLLESMMDAGELPSFSRLREEGSYSRLRTTVPPQSPVAWAGFSTGRNPGKNGVFDFIRRDPSDYSLSLAVTDLEGEEPRPVVRGKKFWERASELGVPVVLLGAPLTFPPDKVRGRLLSGMGVPDLLGTQGTFTYYTTGEAGGETQGGRVIRVRRTSPMVLELAGPRVARMGGAPEHAKVPFKVTIRGDDEVSIRFQGREFSLRKGSWSPWKDVTFKAGPLKRIPGIVRFHLAEVSPELGLYASPVNIDPRDPYLPISHPKGYARELARELGLFSTQGMPMDTWALNEGRLSEEAFLELVRGVLRDKKAMLDLELGRMKDGLLFCYFESPDVIQHMFWRHHDKTHPLHDAKAPAAYKDMIRSWYRRMDGVLGGVMGRMDDGDVLLVLSDHGFGPFRRTVHLNSWLREKGYLKLRGGHKTGGELLRDVDWSATRAYAVGFGSVYLNLKGREKHGIVAPGEAPVLERRIASELGSLKDRGKKVVRRVYRGAEVYTGRFVEEGPDLVVGFERGYRASWQTALGAAPGPVVEDNRKRWSGTHLTDPELVPGILLSNRRFEAEAPSIYDLAPTVLKACGLGSEELSALEMDGEPLF